MQPLISVIVPVYNGQDYLAKCIESIEKQTYRPVEVIIVNDGSTDGTALVCKDLMRQYENIRVLTMEDEGVSAARNAGLDAAKGVFVTFVDADDRLKEKTLEVLYKGIMETGCDICGCRFLPFRKEEEWERLLQQRYRLERAEKYSAKEYLDKEILRGNSRCWSKLYRRAAIGGLRFKKGLSIGEDMLFLVELLPYVTGIAESPYPGYGYYQNPTGAMQRPFTPAYMDQITCWELAREGVRLIDQEQEGRVTSILLMSIMLVAGKLAFLSAGQRRKQKQYIRLCRQKLQEEIRVPGAYEQLDRGYRVKVKLFLYAPGVYLGLYHLRKLL